MNYNKSICDIHTEKKNVNNIVYIPIVYTLLMKLKYQIDRS